MSEYPDKETTAIAISGGIDSNLLQALGKYKRRFTDLFTGNY